MRPYYQDDYCTIYHADFREVMDQLNYSTIITDPIWPNNTLEVFQHIDPYQLFKEFEEKIDYKTCKRTAFVIGCDSDPALLHPVQLPFRRLTWLSYVLPGFKGRILNSGCVGYLYGDFPSAIKKLIPGESLIPEECRAKYNMFKKEAAHPCPRHLEHMNFLVKNWSDPGDIILDPFMGSGTTLEAARIHYRKSIGIEIEEKYCEEAANRLRTNTILPVGD